jgi:hypothetical protein
MEFLVEIQVSRNVDWAALASILVDKASSQVGRGAARGRTLAALLRVLAAGLRGRAPSPSHCRAARPFPRRTT